MADAIAMLAADWGKTAVHTKSTPGFIVNRIARPFYAETLALLHEQAATPAVLDACVRGAGFRMGPCELMDLIGHDTNFAVTQSVYEANFFDKRYQPSLVQREMVDGGLLGRKSGRGFYRYPEGGPRTVDGDAEAPALPVVPLVLRGEGPVADLLASRLAASGLGFTRETPAGDARMSVTLMVGDGVLQPTPGRTATQDAAVRGVPDVAVFDWPVGPAAGPAATPVVPLAYAVAAQSSAAFAEQVALVLRALGWAPQRVKDTPGLVVARTISMLVNEGSDAVDQGVCTPEGADAAMTLGVNYPAGPFAWLALWGPAPIVGILHELDQHYRGERYRASPRLQREFWASAGAPAQP
ncbi:MAG TPA: 3-hydroxyacyl-CoA dehydrogenase family protein [Burkholderiaceae bacterium]